MVLDLVTQPVPQLARRSTRRAVLTAGAAGLALTALGRASAQEETPAPGAGPSWLFVQRFASGRLTLDPAAPGECVLELTGLDPRVLAFTDHPDRMVATVSTAALAEIVQAAAAEPLNASLVTVPAEGGEELAAVVVLAGTVRVEAGSVAYRVKVLAEAEGPRPPAPLDPGTTDQSFGIGHLFVDDAPAVGLGNMTTSVTPDMTGAAQAATAPAYAAGAATEVGGIVKLKKQERKRKPQGR